MFPKKETAVKIRIAIRIKTNLVGARVEQMLKTTGCAAKNSTLKKLRKEKKFRKIEKETKTKKNERRSNRATIDKGVLRACGGR